jgi:hypothetical protein
MAHGWSEIEAQLSFALQSTSPSVGALLPVAPTASSFMWQTLQSAFVGSNGQSCTGRVALAVSDHAVCFEAANDSLECAGSTYSTTYGSSFVPAGLSAVDQIILSATVNSSTGNAACVHQTSGAISCMGNRNGSGQFGNGTTSPSASWVQWGTATNFSRIATGTWDQMCALDATGHGYCSGYMFATTPQLQAGGLFTTLWVSEDGQAQENDPSAFRASDGVSDCQVMTAGLSCGVHGGTNYGVPGSVVAGGQTNTTSVAWLDSSGKAWLGQSSGPNQTTTTQTFVQAGNILYLATNYYTSSVCAVAADASVWCIGNNSQGQLGTGNTNTLSIETQVLPAGSAYIGCH